MTTLAEVNVSGSHFIGASMLKFLQSLLEITLSWQICYEICFYINFINLN